MRRNPRSTTPVRPPPSRAGCGPGGEAGATAVAQPRGGPCRGPPRKPAAQTTIPKRGPPPAPPKRVDYKRPGMTKAMEQRLKHAQKFREEIERKEREAALAQQQRGRRSAPAKRCPPPGPSAGGPGSRERSRAPPAEKCKRKRSSCKSSREPSPCGPGRQSAGPSRTASQSQVPARTLNLAKSMNADIVQAEPLQSGPVDNVIIPPGAINSEKTTIVSIPQPEPADTIHSSTMVPQQPQCPNKSVRVINESLDEQVISLDALDGEGVGGKAAGDQPWKYLAPVARTFKTIFFGVRCSEVVLYLVFGGLRGLVELPDKAFEQVEMGKDATECSIVNSKLIELQQARRDFVLAVANVGNNAISLQDDDFMNINDVTPIADISPPMLGTPEPPSPRLIRCPSVEDNPYLIPEYGRHHPAVEAARDYLRIRQPDRGEDNFVRYPPVAEEFQPQYLDTCIPDEPAPDRSQYAAIPRGQQDPYRYYDDIGERMDVHQLERFCDLARYPPEPPDTPPCPCAPSGPPPGRENLPEDLWDLEDPWYREAECPDLMDFRSF